PALFIVQPQPHRATPLPYTTLFRSQPRPDALACTVEPRIEGLTVATLEIFIHCIVDIAQIVGVSQRLEVVAQLVGERLPDLLVPVEVVVLLGDVKEGAVVQNDPGPGRVRSTPLR